MVKAPAFQDRKPVEEPRNQAVTKPVVANNTFAAPIQEPKQSDFSPFETTKVPKPAKLADEDMEVS